MNIDNLPDKISNLRAYLKLSQASFGKAINLSPTHIARFEKGNCIPSDDIVHTICDVFEVDPRYFSGELALEEAVEIRNLEAGIPQRLKDAREEKGWSQYRLAKESGVPYPIINRVEKGEKLTLKQGLKLAETLEVGIDWLMYGDEDKKRWPVELMSNWLWQNEDVRKELWERMKQAQSV